MTGTDTEDNPKYSGNPVVRIVAQQTSDSQKSMIPAFRVKLHATQASLDPDNVDDLLEAGIQDGELEEVAEDIYCVVK